jgi:hypothetical protein
MSEVVTQGAELQESGPGGDGLDIWSLFMPMLLAVLAYVAAMFLASGPYIGQTGSLESWTHFGQSVAREVLIAVAVLSVSIAISALFPQIGLFIERLVLRSDRRWFLAVVLVFGLLSSALVSRVVLGGVPHNQDEVAMVFQAKVLAAGRLFADTPLLPEFFDHEYVLFDGPRWYGKYFAGPSLALVPGIWLGVMWLVNPLLGAISILLTYVLGRDLLGEKIARVAALLMAVSPFRMSLFSMMMAHPVCLAAIVLAAVAVVKVIRDPRRWGWAVAAGVGLGYAANSRPLTAAVLGAVMGIAAMLALPWRQLRWQTVVAFWLPLLLFTGAYFGYNKALTGDARVTPFEKWCPKDRLGFGPDIGHEYWPDRDRGHSLRKALLQNTQFSLDALGENLSGFGNSALVLLVLAPIVCMRRRVGLVLGAAVLAIIIAYLFYFTPSAFAGQARYWSEAMPAMLLLVAVSLAAVRRWSPQICRFLGIVPAVRTGRAACWLALIVLLVCGAPTAYRAILAQLDLALWTRATRMHDITIGAGLENAVVFIHAKHYRDSKIDARWDSYCDGFAMNSPDLQGPVVFARDLGPEKNAQLLALYPNRRAYYVDPYAAREFELETLPSPGP